MLLHLECSIRRPWCHNVRMKSAYLLWENILVWLISYCFGRNKVLFGASWNCWIQLWNKFQYASIWLKGHWSFYTFAKGREIYQHKSLEMQAQIQSQWIHHKLSNGLPIGRLISPTTMRTDALTNEWNRVGKESNCFVHKITNKVTTTVLCIVSQLPEAAFSSHGPPSSLSWGGSRLPVMWGKKKRKGWVLCFHTADVEGKGDWSTGEAKA